jgi:hypothetical protein
LGLSLRAPLTGEDNFIVDGKQVDRIFLPGEPLVVSHAEYRLENKAPHDRTCNIESCHFIENGTAIPLSAFHLYTGDLSLEKVFVIPPASHLDLRLKFPFREVHVGVHFRYAVQLGLECDGRRYAATSTLNIIQEQG